MRYVYVKHSRLFSIFKYKSSSLCLFAHFSYSSEQMFNVVSDVKNYDKFVPFCKKSLILESNAQYLRADLEIGFPPIVESYTSRVTMNKPYLVSAICTDGKLFDTLKTIWQFSPGLKHNAQTCIVDFYIEFEFKNLVHSQLANMFFEKLCNQMEKAFITEAKNRYGQASLPSHPLTVVRS